MVIGNFEKIEENIKEYKDLNFLLGELQSKLEEVLQSLKKERKNPLSTQGVNKQIATLNEERESLKEKISLTKKQIKQVFAVTEQIIFSGINGKYSEVYERQLSRLYGYKIDVLVKNPGELYDEQTCIATSLIVTKNKSQHKKIVKMIDFGIRDSHTFYTERKIRVEVCVYSKKHKAGEVIPFDRELLQ
ncbi:MAG: hypothetical protein E7358_06455 [Clostridiales bacterium]|nr:hypothetical protein [Clostridiales bacterium]